METAEAVQDSGPADHTPLKQGVNEICETHGVGRQHAYPKSGMRWPAPKTGLKTAAEFTCKQRPNRAL
jgi:hypothetical protein